ncbi:unnamed protein product [Penicillium glandicola]
MYFSKAVIAVTASLVTLGLAADPLAFTSWPKEPLEAGKAVTLTWTGAAPDQPVTIVLRQGPSDNLKDVKAITTDAEGGIFTWTPGNDIEKGSTYAFQILQKDQSNYTALLRSAGKPVAHGPEDENTTETGTATATTTPTGTTTGTTTNTQTTGSTLATQQTPKAHTTTSTTSKALISSSAGVFGSPSSSAAASSSGSPLITGTKNVNGKEASSTGSAQAGVASNLQYSIQFVLGIAGLVAYLI